MSTAALAISPTAVSIYSNNNTILLTGVGTSWTPGTPGSPTFTVDIGTILSQVVISSNTAALVYDSPIFGETATFTDPSTGYTATIILAPYPMTTIRNDFYITRNAIIEGNCNIDGNLIVDGTINGGAGAPPDVLTVNNDSVDFPDSYQLVAGMNVTFTPGSSPNTLTISATPGAGGVSSVTNNDGSLTISPTTGAVVASLNTGNANTWTAIQTFSDGVIYTSGTIQQVRVVTASGSIAVSTSDYAIIVRKTTGAATVVDLPVSPTAGQTYMIKDGKGDAHTNNITLVPASGTIDGASTYVMNTNYASKEVIYTGVEWSVL